MTKHCRWFYGRNGVLASLGLLALVNLLWPGQARAENAVDVVEKTTSRDLNESASNLATPVLRVEVGKHSAAIRRLAVDEARHIVVTASDDKTARVWDLGSGELRLVLRPPIGRGDLGRLYGAAVHPSLPLVAVGGISASARDSQSI